MVFSFASDKFKRTYGFIIELAKKIIEYIKTLKLFKTEEPRFLTLTEEIDIAHQEWMNAKKVFEEIDKELIDYAVFRLNAAERKYMYLLDKAKKEGVSAWRDEQYVNNCE